MHIVVRHRQEVVSGGFWAERNLRLTAEIRTTLSADDRALVELYQDPLISLAEAFSSEEWKQIHVSMEGHELTDCVVTLWTEKGFSQAAQLRRAEDLVIKRLGNEMIYLRDLFAWQGEQTIEV